MYGRGGRRHRSEEVTLTRLQALDERVNRYKKRRGGKAAAVALTVTALTAAGVSGFYYRVAEGSGEAYTVESVAGPVREKFPEEILGEPAAVTTGEIVVLAQEPALRAPLIAIDAGHGGDDEGCSRGDVWESEINLALAESLSCKLEEMGYETLMIREDAETAMTTEERADKAKEAKADIYVSIHQNACEEPESGVSGIETWYYGESAESWRLARLIHRGAVDKSGAMDREVRDTDELYVIREAGIPACLIETGFLSNTKERESLATEEYRDKLAEGMARGIDLYFCPKTMYLTFDDGPSEDNTTAVLDILKEKGIKATFFVVGENVRKNPEVARRIVEEGHTIGIHCNWHDYTELYKSKEAFLEDFQKAYDAVYEITGVEAKLFRFPGGSVNSYNGAIREDIIAEMTERGFIYFDWNASLEDAVKNSTPEGLLGNALNSTLGRKKVVMLAHDVIYNTTQCLEELLDSFPEYEMKPLTPEVEPVQF